MWQGLHCPCFINHASCWVPSLTGRHEILQPFLPRVVGRSLKIREQLENHCFWFSSFSHLNCQEDTDLWPQEVIGRVNYVL